MNIIRAFLLAAIAYSMPANAQQTINNMPFDGDFFEGDSNKPGIVLVAGSGMYKDNETAMRLARLGYNVLSLAYYDSEGRGGLPETLEMIPLEYFDAPKKWLLDRSNGVMIFGLSKGAELSLLLASQDPDYKAVIALAPSKVVWQGFPKDFSKIMESPSSWSKGGEEVPFLPYISREKQNELGVDNRHEASLTQKAAVEKALINVAEIKVPTLLLSGGKDSAWPSAKMANEICEKIGKHCRHISYLEGGHLLEGLEDEYFSEIENFLKSLP